MSTDKLNRDLIDSLKEFMIYFTNTPNFSIPDMVGLYVTKNCDCCNKPQTTVSFLNVSEMCTLLDAVESELAGTWLNLRRKVLQQ